MERQEPTETSPLLAKPTATLPDPRPTPSSVQPNEVAEAVHQNGASKHVQDEENQSKGEDRGHQYEGMPDVKAKLWSIVPAVGIGVRPFLRYCIDSMLTFSRYFFQLQTRPSLCPATERSVVI